MKKALIAVSIVFSVLAMYAMIDDDRKSAVASMVFGCLAHPYGSTCDRGITYIKQDLHMAGN